MPARVSNRGAIQIGVSLAHLIRILTYPVIRSVANITFLCPHDELR